MSAFLVELSQALRASYLSASQVNEFLRTKLDRRFDDLSSRYIPLTDSISDIVQKAYEQGWIADLVRKAAEDRPKNDAFRKLLDSLPSLDPHTTPSLGRSQVDRPSLLCGRASQWLEVCQCAPARLHHVILVPGGRGQDPMHFRERVQVWLTPDPSRTMTSIRWQTPPKSLDEMVDALAVALEATVDGVGQALKEKLAHQNVVLLHPVIDEGFTQSHLIEYYTKWLPGALSQRTAGALKCLQPVEWPVREQASGLLSRLLSRTGASSAERTGALGLITALKGKQDPQVRIIDVDELVNLENRELEQFLEGSEFTPEHQRLLLSKLLGGPSVPGYMFKTIDEYWKNIGAQ